MLNEFAPDVFPTSYNSVLVRCFYKQVGFIEGIDEIFMRNIEKMLSGDACDVYIAMLYINVCIYHEEKGKLSTFKIDIELLIGKLREGLKKHKVQLQDRVDFANGLFKPNPWWNVESFNRRYKREYGFSIID